MNILLFVSNVVILLLFTTFSVILADCPSGWKHWGNKCYIKFSRGRNYYKAKEFCARNDAEMLTIESPEENDYLVRNFGYISVILGAKRVGASDEWVWNDGRPVKYTNWNEHEPNNWNNNENCIQYYNAGPHAGKWNDYPCSTSDWTMCQIVLNRDVLLNSPEETEDCRTPRESIDNIFNIAFKYF